ncbi:MAG: hypothetical protein KAI47_00065, partial [Deltaproteobacteria bacterium]|nr:hypothetical protein [Deltaproteobacteria bacterium]
MREALRTFMWWIGAPLVLFTLLYVVVWAHYRIDAPRLISGPQEDEVIAILRRGIRGAPPRPEAVAKIVDIPLRGPLWVTLFRRGEAALRLRRDEKTLRSAIAAATSELSRRPEVQAWRPEERHAIRIKVDITLAEGPIISAIPLFFAKGIVPGLDGLGIEVNGKHRAYILPDELYKRQLLAGYRPFFFMHEFKTGIDLRAVINTFARDLSLSIEAWRDASKRFFRLRLQSFVEAPPDEKPGEGASRNALDVVRLRVPVDRINKSTVIQAVKRSADYILRQIEPSGRFHYIYYPLSDRHDGGRDYSLPRHAGTTWFLSLAYAKLRKARYRRGARRAIRYLATHAVPPSCKTKSFACVGTEAYADLGSAGLTILAIVEYTEATGDRLYVPLARRLGQFVLDMQKDNG